MIITILSGGLGNQMFQYALGRHLSIKNADQLFLNIESFNNDQVERSFDLFHFKIQGNIYNREKNCDNHRNLITSIFKKRLIQRFTKKDDSDFLNIIEVKKFEFDPKVLEIKGNILLNGSWQNFRYFEGIRSQLLMDFTLKKEPEIINKKALIMIKDTESVAIHIRRGDYVDNPNTKKFHGPCSQNYYQNAIKLITEKITKPSFFIFSDDLSWAKKNISTDSPQYFIDWNCNEQHYEDLRLMCACKHHIISNSTFSWWSAWIGHSKNQIVIAPSPWLDDTQYDTEGIYLPDWIIIQK